LQGIPCDCINGEIVCDQPSGKKKKGAGASSNDINTMIMSTLVEALFTAAFTTDSTAAKPDNQAAQKAAAEQAAKQAALEKARAAAAQAEFEKMMRSYKKLGNAQNVTYKTLSDSNLSYKPLGNDVGSLAARAAGKEQREFETMNAAWMEKQRALIEQRLAEPNKYAGAICKSLTTNAPPLPYKRFSELQPGDVLLLEGEGFSNAIPVADNAISSGRMDSSGAAHTVLYLKSVNGKKLFLDNQPGQGPRIIAEEEFLKTYGNRTSDVARLAQPLRPDEAKKLYEAAREMAGKNNRALINDHMFDSSNYGVWRKDNVVCSEADWAVINAAGRNIPESDDKLKVAAGVNWSPADYASSQYFLVTPLARNK